MGRGYGGTVADGDWRIFVGGGGSIMRSIYLILYSLRNSENRNLLEALKIRRLVRKIGSDSHTLSMACFTRSDLISPLFARFEMSAALVDPEHRHAMRLYI